MQKKLTYPTNIELGSSILWNKSFTNSKLQKTAVAFYQDALWSIQYFQSLAQGHIVPRHFHSSEVRKWQKSPLCLGVTLDSNSPLCSWETHQLFKLKKPWEILSSIHTLWRTPQKNKLKQTRSAPENKHRGRQQN